jgi:D-sedoheptulose 7-phosphate isomerase
MSVKVFTNGCFDIIHPGHISLLERAKALGTHLTVGINSDESIRKIKGAGRPIVSQESRREVLLGLQSVDEVHIFEELTPHELIKRLKPDILVKGGDWKPEEIVGAEIVLGSGGSVYSLPLLDGHSSSDLIERIQAGTGRTAMDKTTDAGLFSEHIYVMENLSAENGESIHECFEIMKSAIRRGNKILICGNGGSAADAQHLAAELVGRYEAERGALPAIALTTDTSALTALSNDYGFERIFSRQVEALANEGDCLIAISTSGNSPNVISAVMTARSAGCSIIGMTGSEGRKLAALCDACIMVPSNRTARIQEAHISIIHFWCETIDRDLVGHNLKDGHPK